MQQGEELLELYVTRFAVLDLFFASFAFSFHASTKQPLLASIVIRFYQSISMLRTKAINKETQLLFEVKYGRTKIQTTAFCDVPSNKAVLNVQPYIQ